MPTAATLSSCHHCAVDDFNQRGYRLTKTVSMLVNASQNIAGSWLPTEVCQVGNFTARLPNALVSLHREYCSRNHPHRPADRGEVGLGTSQLRCIWKCSRVACDVCPNLPSKPPRRTRTVCGYSTMFERLPHLGLGPWLSALACYVGLRGPDCDASQSRPRNQSFHLTMLDMSLG